VVVERRRDCGIISARGKELAMKVDQILQAKGSDVFSISGDANLASAVEILAAHNIGAVIVRNPRGIAGVLSERDIVRHLRKQGAGALEAKVSDCMTPNPYTCGLETTVDELMALMTKKRIRHLPVLDGGELVGVVSIGDVVKRKIEEAEHEAAALRDYISS
jgi:CBS domain-containing protein